MTTDNPKVSKPRHNSAPWTDELSPLIEPGDDRVRLGQLQVPPSTACRILAEENFQFAKECVNEVARLRQERDDLVGALRKCYVQMRFHFREHAELLPVGHYNSADYDATFEAEQCAQRVLAKHRPE